MRRLLLTLLLATTASNVFATPIPNAVTSYSDLTYALTHGGTWNVTANITMNGTSVFDGVSNVAPANSTLTLIGACSPGPCVLDGAGKFGHFVVQSGWLLLQGLTLANGARGYSTVGWTSSTPPIIYDPCPRGSWWTDGGINGGYFDSTSDGTPQGWHQRNLSPVNRSYCGSTVVLPTANFSASNCVFSNNFGFGDSSNGNIGAGGALTLIVAPNFFFSLLNCTFKNNKLNAPVYYHLAPRDSLGGAVYIVQVTLLAGNVVDQSSGLPLPYSLPLSSSSPGHGLIFGCTFSNNVATFSGGAIYSRLTIGSVVIDSCLFMGNVVGQASVIPKSGVGVSGGAISLKGQYTGNYRVINAAPFSVRAKYVLRRTVFSGNSAGILTGSSATNPFPTTSGGAIFSSFSGLSLHIENCTFSGNAAHQGGAVFFSSTSEMANILTEDPEHTTSSYDYYGSTSSTTTSSAQVKVLYASSDLSSVPRATETGYGLSISGSTFNGNTALGGYLASGGALFVSCALVNVSTSTFANNSVTDPTPPAQPGVSTGGAIVATNDCLTSNAVTHPTVTALVVDSCAFISNYAAYRGGAIALAQSARFQPFPSSSHVFGVSLAATRTSFSGHGINTIVGGAVYAETNSRASFANCSFSGNMAVNGAATYQTGGTVMSFSNSSFSGNSATLGGCAYLSSGGNISFDASSTFTSNSATIGSVLYTNDTVPGLTVAGALVNRSGSPWLVADVSNIALNYGQAIAHTPTNYTVLVRGAPVGSTLITRSGAPLLLSVVLTDAYNQTVAFWQDMTVVASCSSSPAALSGKTQTAYALGSASLSTLAVSGTVGQSFPLVVTLASLTLSLISPAVRVNITITIDSCKPLETFDASSLRCLCAVGTYLNSTSGECIRCPAGTFSPQAGATVCQINPTGQVSVTVTTAISTVVLHGVPTSTLGTAQYSFIRESVGNVLNISGSSVRVVSVLPLSTNRHLLSSTSLNVSVTTTATAQTTAVLAGLNDTSVFGTHLTSLLQASGDVRLAVITGATATAPAASFQYTTQECSEGAPSLHVRSCSK
jgi:predicted outer membrane repeat protein